MQTLRILWAAILSSTLAFAGLLIAGVGDDVSEPPPVLLALASAVMAITIAVMSFLLPRQVHVRTLRAKNLAVVEEADPSSAFSNYRGSLGKRKVFADPASARSTAIRLAQTPMILALALSESIALFGFVLGFLRFPLLMVAPFFALSWTLILLRFPTDKAAVAALERTYGATLVER
jgi:hypothetical protein